MTDVLKFLVTVAMGLGLIFVGFRDGRERGRREGIKQGIEQGVESERANAFERGRVLAAIRLLDGPPPRGGSIQATAGTINLDHHSTEFLDHVVMVVVRDDTVYVRGGSGW